MSDKDFKLKSDSEGFDNRTKDIFANIDSLATAASKKQNNYEEKAKEKHNSRNERDRGDLRRVLDEKNQKKTEEFKGRESIFRSPNESGWPPAQSRHDRKRPYNHGNQRGPRRTPDHVVNPSKYKKYDLSDVSKDQLSDRSNSRAAFDFLRELKERKNEEGATNEPAEKVEDRKVSFKKPSTFKKPSSVESASKSSVVQDGHKRIMAECVVGQKVKKSVVKSDKTSEKSKIKSSKTTISLSHLDDEDEEDSD